MTRALAAVAPLALLLACPAEGPAPTPASQAARPTCVTPAPALAEQLDQVPGAVAEPLAADVENQSNQLLGVHLRIADQAAGQRIVDDGLEQTQHVGPLGEPALLLGLLKRRDRVRSYEFTGILHVRRLLELGGQLVQSLAVLAGVDLLQTDSDLDNLRTDPRFKKLAAEVAGR